MNQMNMLRENEYLRERMSHREHDKIERATEKINDATCELNTLLDLQFF